MWCYIELAIINVVSAITDVLTIGVTLFVKVDAISSFVILQVLAMVGGRYWLAVNVSIFEVWFLCDPDYNGTETDPECEHKADSFSDWGAGAIMIMKIAFVVVLVLALMMACAACASKSKGLACVGMILYSSLGLICTVVAAWGTFMFLGLWTFSIHTVFQLLLLILNPIKLGLIAANNAGNAKEALQKLGALRSKMIHPA